jgi:hypothetical protein
LVSQVHPKDVQKSLSFPDSFRNWVYDLLPENSAAKKDDEAQVEIRSSFPLK